MVGSCFQFPASMDTMTSHACSLLAIVDVLTTQISSEGYGLVLSLSQRAGGEIFSSMEPPGAN